MKKDIEKYIRVYLVTQERVRIFTK